MNAQIEMMTVDARGNRDAAWMEVYLNGEKVDHAFRAYVPKEPNIEAEGWLDGYATGLDGHLIVDEEAEEFIIAPRVYGKVKWMPKVVTR